MFIGDQGLIFKHPGIGSIGRLPSLGVEFMQHEYFLRKQDRIAFFDGRISQVVFFHAVKEVFLV